MTELMSRPVSACDDPDGLVTIGARFDDPLHMVVMVGDRASRAAAVDAWGLIDHVDVVVDVSGPVFTECAGYDVLAASRSILERRGGCVVLMDPVGEPLRVLALIEEALGDSSDMSRRDTLDRWAAALVRGDDGEIDRLVRQSHTDRLEGATSGRLGEMVGQVDPSPALEALA